MEVKICECGASTESPSGCCRDCLKNYSRLFWKRVEACRPARLEVSRRNENLLKTLTGCLAKACAEALENKIYGTSRDHVESVTLLPDEDGVFALQITTWSSVSENTRETKKLSLIETMDILAVYIGDRATRIAAEELSRRKRPELEPKA
jgi:hypothetical protein